VSAASSPASAFPERVGKYELLLPLGTGGTATVYLARTRGVAGFEREVALKLVHAHLRSDEESRLHLLEEARLAARIRHPNVVPVTEVDADACGVFLVMDYVEGEALSGLVRLLRERNHRLPPRLVARIMNDALAGLHAAHDLRDVQGQLVGLVHRDFSPQNILIGIEGVTRLADFGVAKAASRTVRTKTGLVKGKVAYMSPEQARGHKVDRRCDVWAAGVVVWELVTGRKLYDHEDDVATLLSVVTEEPPRLASVMQGVPPALDEAVAHALTSDVGNRCPSAEAFRCMLESAWDECGGMATNAELAAFVRQTVGHKLSERRALAARGRTPATGSGEALSGVAGAPSALALARSSTQAPAPEDGTKTAISAAVPAADRLGGVPQIPIWKRRMAVAGLTTAALALVVTGVAVTRSEEAPPSANDKPALTAPPAKPPAARALPPNSMGAASPASLKDVGSERGHVKAAVVNGEVQEPIGAATANAEVEPSAPAVTTRSAKRASATRPKPTVAKNKPKASRTAVTRTAKSSASGVRSAPVPQQRKPSAPGEPQPLHLAPDPYDSKP
jgi:eukaryotic-like serine/threonine-protein kinase